MKGNLGLLGCWGAGEPCFDALRCCERAVSDNGRCRSSRFRPCFIRGRRAVGRRLIAPFTQIQKPLPPSRLSAAAQTGPTPSACCASTTARSAKSGGRLNAAPAWRMLSFVMFSVAARAHQQCQRSCCNCSSKRAPSLGIFVPKARRRCPCRRENNTAQCSWNATKQARLIPPSSRAMLPSLLYFHSSTGGLGLDLSMG